MKEKFIDPRVTPEARREAHIHYVISFCGGFLGLFPVVNVVKLLGSAQTSNLIDCVISLLGRNWTALFYHLLGVFLYALAAFLVTFLKTRLKLNIKFLAVFTDIAAGFVMWLLPEGLPKVVYLYPTFFAMSFQWCSFSGGYGFACSSIFSTNNLRQTVSSLTEWLCNGKIEFKLKTAFYGAVLASFHLGAAVSFILWEALGNVSFTFAAFPALLAGIMIALPIKK